MVGMTGFEPTASASRTQRSTKLSHIPESKRRCGTKVRRIACLVARLGFEPRQTESESVVLPLHNRAVYSPCKRGNDSYYTRKCPVCQLHLPLFLCFCPQYKKPMAAVEYLVVLVIIKTAAAQLFPTQIRPEAGCISAKSRTGGPENSLYAVWQKIYKGRS